MRPLIFLIFAVSCTTAITYAQNNTPGMRDNFTLVVHGGAGTILKKNMTPEAESEYTSKLQEALQAGYEVLNKGGSSIEAVEATIVILEDSPLFNAGKGSVFTNDEKNEMDASVMDGKTLNAGSVAGVTTIKNPIRAARLVMEKSSHVMLAGKGAEKFAKENGAEIVDPKYFRDEKRYRQLQQIKGTEKQELDHSNDRGGAAPGSQDVGFDERTDKKFGTVGAVAVDKYANLAAGTSTGGMTNKMYGRVGDSPIIGAGTYANNKTCAVSCTGHGEYFMRGLVAYDISAMIEYKNIGLKEAADEVIQNKQIKLGGSGGVIAVDAEGNIAMPFNTEGMYRGYIKEDGKANIFIYKE